MYDAVAAISVILILIPERFMGKDGFVGERLVKFPQPVVAYV